MRTLQDEVRSLVDREGVVSRADHPELRGATERLFHRILHNARIAWWKSNLGVVIDGHLYYIDVAFPGLKLAVEIDGRLHETDEDLFESDRWRQNALVLDGWMVLRFTWTMLRDHPDVVLRDVKAAITIRRRRFPGRR